MEKKVSQKVNQKVSQNIKQKVVLLTGCSSGIGRDMCSVLKQQGYIVVATARHWEALEQVPADLRLELDVTDKESIEHTVKQVMASYGHIDILVNNAGFSVRGALEEVDLTQAKQLFDVNVFGILNMLQAVLPIMRVNRSGRVINIGSISGRFSQTINGVYCASKHSVEAITQSLRLEMKQFGIDATVIEPGAIETGFFQNLANRSDQWMQNQSSPYVKMYHSDQSYRAVQKRSPSIQIAEQICSILTKKKIRPRYQVGVSAVYKVMVHLPDGIREWILLHH